MAPYHQQVMNKYINTSENMVRRSKYFNNEVISVLHQFIVDNTAESVDEVAVHNSLGWKHTELYESFDFEELQGLLEAFLEGTNFAVTMYMFNRFPAPITLTKPPVYGAIDIRVMKDTYIKEEPTNLTPREIYEQNKTSQVCVSCGNQTTQTAVFSSLINYCKGCCG